jgi:uncharacterized repeat protein (TIGR03803 family)
MRTITANSRRGRCFHLTMTCLFLIFGLGTAIAQPPSFLYSFTGGSDGGKPTARLTPDAAGNLYGTTEGGGLGFGTVFQLSPNGAGGWNETVLYRFTGGSDGSAPLYSPVIFDTLGNLYGETKFGGSKNQGVVFKLSPNGGGWTQTVLHSFVGGTSEGCYPSGALVMDAAGNIFGTNHGCGGGTRGTVFELSPGPGASWIHRIIYGVMASYGGLTLDGSGNIFGTSRDNKIFELSPNGAGGWNAAVLHVFSGSPFDGLGPQSAMTLDNAGNLYGTTQRGGVANRGAVYKLTHGMGGWTESILYSFPAGKNVLYSPFGGVAVDASNNVYGTATRGFFGGGVFKLNASSNYSESNLSIFDSTGWDPQGTVILDSAGKLYGTVFFSGRGQGGVFEVTP